MSNTSAWQIFVWVALPYLALGIFVVGHVWRWRYDQFGWTSRSTQLQERRLLKWGSRILHCGTFAAIGGHAIGGLIPERWTHAIGIPETTYRWFSAAAGTLAAVLIIAGVVILAGRRLLVRRVRATTSPVDYVALILLLIIILTGIIPTVFVNLLGHGYDYRTTVAPWFRGHRGDVGGAAVAGRATSPGRPRCSTTVTTTSILVSPPPRTTRSWSRRYARHAACNASQARSGCTARSVAMRRRQSRNTPRFTARSGTATQRPRPVRPSFTWTRPSRTTVARSSAASSADRGDVRA